MNQKKSYDIQGEVEQSPETSMRTTLQGCRLGVAGPRRIPGDGAEACTGGTISGSSVQARAHLHTSWGEMGAMALQRDAERWGLALPGEDEHEDGCRLFAVLKQEFCARQKKAFPHRDSGSGCAGSVFGSFPSLQGMAVSSLILSQWWACCSRAGPGISRVLCSLNLPLSL